MLILIVIVAEIVDKNFILIFFAYRKKNSVSIKISI